MCLQNVLYESMRVINVTFYFNFLAKIKLRKLENVLLFQVPLVPEGQEGTKDLRDYLVSQARRERKETRELLGSEDLEESRVVQDHRAFQG